MPSSDLYPPGVSEDHPHFCMEPTEEEWAAFLEQDKAGQEERWALPDQPAKEGEGECGD